MADLDQTNDHYERQLQRIAERFGVSVDELLVAIDTDGPEPERVFAALEQRRAA